VTGFNGCDLEIVSFLCSYKRFLLQAIAFCMYGGVGIA
jgi:hypothetical protein